MGKHKHKKSKKSKKSSRNDDSSDEWEETTAPDEGTFRSKARSKMRMPQVDEQDEASSTNVHSSQSARRSKGDQPSWRKKDRKEPYPETGSSKEFLAETAVDETVSVSLAASETDRAKFHQKLDLTLPSVASTRETILDAESDDRSVKTSLEPSIRQSESRDLEQASRDCVRSSSTEVAAIAKKSHVDPMEQATEILSDDKMNQLSAKILKAELRGDQETVQRLKTKLDLATKARAEAQQTTEDTERTVVIITEGKKHASGGQKRSSGASSGRSNRKKNRPEDAWQRLEDKFVRKKVEDDEKMNAVLQRAINKMDAGSSRGDADADEDHQLDDDQDQESDSRAYHGAPGSDRTRSAEFSEHCQFCVDSAKCVKHLIVYSGENVSLMLPQNVSLTDFHCLLVPREHSPLLTQADEDTWTAIQDLRKLLSDIFEAEGMDCIFLQTTTVVSRRAHAVMHCVPVPNEAAEMMPMYFRKAIEECETEWSMNKKLVRLSDGGVRTCIPKGLPYFAVDFGKQNGYAHVIEDRERFPDYFGLEIIGSVLDVTPSAWLRPRSESFQDQSKKVVRFENIWTKHECEKKLAS